jgi:hypothetical protein
MKNHVANGRDEIRRNGNMNSTQGQYKNDKTHVANMYI